MRLKLFLPVIFICFAVSACTKVQKIEYAKSIDHPQDAYPAPIKFSRLKVQLPVGAEIGIHRTKCFLSFYEAGRHYLNGNISQPLIDDIFAQTLEAQGFDVVNRLNSVFDEEYEDEFLRSEYKVGGKIIDAQINTCEVPDKKYSFPLKIMDPLYIGNGGFKGKLYLKIEWGVYDSLHRRVVYKTVTEGYVNHKSASQEGISLMINEAFSMAAHNLGADKNFHDLIFYNEKPPQNWRKKKEKESRPRIFDPQEKVVITNPDLSTTPLIEHVSKSTKVGVLVQAGSGHGSGFFISDQGHIITNAHVVGNAMRVRIVTAGRKKKLVAEVLRKSSRRDVALLKLEEIPDDLEIITMPIRLQYPKVSEDIYALGAPEHKRLQDSLSKGIVSSIRKNFSVYGMKLNFIQGDVVIRGGNSGGPLLDKFGNIIGISVAGMYRDIGEGDSGLNLFIPINDALNYLDISIKP